MDNSYRCCWCCCSEWRRTSRSAKRRDRQTQSERWTVECSGFSCIKCDADVDKNRCLCICGFNTKPPFHLTTLISRFVYSGKQVLVAIHRLMTAMMTMLTRHKLVRSRRNDVKCKVAIFDTNWKVYPVEYCTTLNVFVIAMLLHLMLGLLSISAHSESAWKS